jgi:hypothetical protein
VQGIAMAVEMMALQAITRWLEGPTETRRTTTMMGMEVMQNTQPSNRCRTSTTTTNIQMLKTETISNPSTSLV